MGQASSLSLKQAEDRQDACPTGIAAGSFATDFEVATGAVRELTIAEFVVPDVDRPARATLRASVRIGETTAENEWPLWFFPAPPLAPPAVRLIDPAGRLDSLGDWLSEPCRPGGAPAEANLVVIATEGSDELERHVAAGGRAILLQSCRGIEGPAAAVPMPFWREAVKVIEPHAAWGDFPHEGWCDLQFFGLATDHALDSSRRPHARPILRRVDARTMAMHDYALELTHGAGRVIASTLRFEGGLGEQPVALSRNTAAAYLLACWVRYLADAPPAETPASFNPAPPLYTRWMPDAMTNAPATPGAVDDALLEMLRCPLTLSRLRPEGGELVAEVGGLRYPVRDGIPQMLVEEARLPEGVGSLAELKTRLREQGVAVRE